MKYLAGFHPIRTPKYCIIIILLMQQLNLSGHVDFLSTEYGNKYLIFINNYHNIIIGQNVVL